MSTNVSYGDSTLSKSTQTTAPETEQETTVVSDVATSAESSVAGPDDSTAVTVVIAKPKTTEELIAARALKRAARKAEVREKAKGHKRTGDLLFEEKKYKLAYQQYLEATQLWPSNPDLFISLAGAYRKLQWYEEAAYAATQALTLDPKNSEARYVRGVARMEQRLLKPARIDFETVLEHDPQHLLSRAALTEVTHFIGTSGHLGGHALAPNPVEELTKDVDFGFPHYDQEALEIASVSDSSDYNHVGNGVQCRFYNHEGCARGSACMFSHAPDEKSVRDELGRNVCTYFLLESCKFGPAKCIYSHSKEALPTNGWWSSPEQIEKAKAMMAVAEQQNREQRQLENERWKEHLKAVKAAGRPPKSAGVKRGKRNAGEKRHNEETQADAPADAAAELAVNDIAAPAAEGKQAAHNKKPDGQKQKPQSKKKPVAKAAPATTDTPAAPVDALESAEKTDPITTLSGFTDYKQDEHPADINPDTSIVLQY